MPTNLPASNRKALLRSAREEFAERYHRWALIDARRETDEDFPFVRKVRSQTAYRFLEMIEPMGKRERLELISALVKRFHMAGPVAASELITAKDQILITSYLEYDHGEITPGVSARLPILRDGKHKQLIETARPFKLAKINRKALHRAIVERLRGVCGQTVRDYGAGSSYFESAVGTWIMRTEFSTCSKFRHLDYSHSLVTPGGLMVGQGLTLLRWLGMAGQTYWVLEDESQVEDAVEALGAICTHFLRVAGTLLQDFEPPISKRR
jgi:hypothetical protein